MRAQVQLTIGRLMGWIMVAAVDSALIAWSIRVAPSHDLGRWYVLSNLLLVNGLALDAFLLVRRARAGRPPFGPVWSQTTFIPQMILVLLCLYMPFGWVLGAEPIRHGWPVLGLILPGFGAIIPLHWVVHQRTVLEGPVIALTTTLLLMGLVRLVARGHGPWACGLALLVAVPSSLFAHAAYSF